MAALAAGCAVAPPLAPGRSASRPWWPRWWPGCPTPVWPAVRVPIHRRQVNERWLDQYRSWVYGAGFGWQIGTGLATYITTAAVYLMVVLGALSTSPAVALAIGCGFGLCRGLAVFLTARITNPTALRAFHRRFTEAGPTVGRVATTVEFVVGRGTGRGPGRGARTVARAAIVVPSWP